jgi:hypothetical protein
MGGGVFGFVADITFIFVGGYLFVYLVGWTFGNLVRGLTHKTKPDPIEAVRRQKTLGDARLAENSEIHSALLVGGRAQADAPMLFED